MSKASKTTTETAAITGALCKIGKDLGFQVETERSVRRAGAPRIERRSDVAYLDSDGRILIAFEIDHDRDRSTHNFSKYLTEAPAAADFPACVVRVWFRDAAAATDPSLDSMDRQVAILLPAFQHTLRVDPNDRLNDHIKSLLGQLDVGPHNLDPENIISSYQPLLRQGGLRFVKAVLSASADAASHGYTIGKRTLEDAASIRISIAAILQRAGHHRSARQHLDQLECMISLWASRSPLSGATTDLARSVRALLSVSKLGTNAAQQNLTEAIAKIRTPSVRRRILWRMALSESTVDRAEALIRDYEASGEDAQHTASNVSLAMTCSLIRFSPNNWRERAREYSSIYAQTQYEMWDNPSHPGGTMHGVIAGMALQARVLVETGDTKAHGFLERVDELRQACHINQRADGIREIASVAKLKRQPRLDWERRVISLLDSRSDLTRQLYYELRKRF